MTVPEFTTSAKEKALEPKLPTLELGQPDRLLDAAERLGAWTAAFGAGELAPHQMKGYRTVMGWRLTRAIGFKQGRLNLDERLAEAFPESKDWSEIRVAPKTRILLKPDSRRPQDQWALSDLLARNGGIGIAPTKATAKQHAHTIAKLAEVMWLTRGSTTFPRLGYYGLHGLTSPETVLEFWPERREILAFEDKIIDQIQGLVLKWSRRKIQSHLRDLFDLTVKEIGGLISLATQEAKTQAGDDIETIRHVMAGRTEDYIDRMRECADSSNEMKGLKLLCAIQGLHKADPENTAEMLIGVIAKVASDHAIDPSPMRITATPVDDDDDDEVTEET